MLTDASALWEDIHMDVDYMEPILRCSCENEYDKAKELK